MHKVLVFFITWRAVLFLPLILAAFLVPFRHGFEYITFWTFVEPSNPWYHYLFFPWASFDGIHYLSIARYGYDLNGRFFPLLPILIFIASYPFRIFFADGPVFEILELGTAIVLTFIIVLFAITAFYKLIRIDYSEKIAFWSIIYLLFFPASFFYAAIYTEGLFLLLTAATFYCMRKQQWGKASIFAMLLSVTRPVGILILPILLFEYVREKRRSYRQMAQFLFIPAGLLLYSFFNYVRWHDALYFLHSQGEVGNSRSVTSIVFPLQTIFRYGKILFTLSPAQYEWWIASLELGIFLTVSVLLFIAWKKRVRLSYILFAVLCFLVPVFSGTFTGLPRYSIVLFPIFIALSLVENKFIRYSYLLIGPLLQCILLMLFSRGYFVA